MTARLEGLEIPRPPEKENGRPRVTRVQLTNFKNIERADVRLNDLNLLVGKNGAGKSNFIDALSFVSDALSTTLEHAVRARGGIKEVRRRGKTQRGGHPVDFEIRLSMEFPGRFEAFYEFRVGAVKGFEFIVREEKCRVVPKDMGPYWEFIVRGGRRIAGPPELTAKVRSDALYLQAVSGTEPFADVFDALSDMGFYNINPDVIRDIQTPDASPILKKDGSNLASVLKEIQKHHSSLHDRLTQYMAAIVPGLSYVRFKQLGAKETVEFGQSPEEGQPEHVFPPGSMSDGTLRALGILVALFQPTAPRGGVGALVGIEEPEAALHPEAARILSDALLEASRARQVVVATHSADILENPELDPASIVVVLNFKGNAIVGPLGDDTIESIRDHLVDGGELLRSGGLRPQRSAAEHLDLAEWL